MAEQQLTISSTAFPNGGDIPSDYTCEGAGKNPPLNIEGIPEGTKSLVLIMDDPDAPNGTFDHWIVWNIPPDKAIKADSTPGETGKNSRGENRYTGPCPPSGTHRYFFKVYALDDTLKLKSGAEKREVEDALKDHVLGYGELVGKYRKRQ